LFVPESGQDIDKMYKKLLSITDYGNSDEICNSIQQQVWPKWSPTPPPTPSSKNNYLKIIFLVLILVFFGIIGFLIFLKNKNK
jgi:hypothetical protein